MEKILDINKILEYLPHRFPFLLVDKVIGFEPGKSITAVKNVTVNEPFFPGHFPQKPVFPGVLIVEAMAQTTGLLAFATEGGAPSGSLFYLVAVDNARFKQPVEPGDQLIMDVEFIKAMRGVWKFSASAKVDGKVVASAELMCAVRDA
ncbi:MAG: 3-hydroxyacyl-ACP dehydratase FabZ [Gammaproteobacteria bacterium]|nr:3-hydroxyacyl-ACP dehydratase FabZ [Gammaproteobacteria bacterium]